MATSALASTVVMGAVLLVILAAVLRLRHWEHPSAAAAAGASSVARSANGPLGWTVAFLVAAFGVMGLIMLYASGQAAYGIDSATLGLLVLVALGAVIGVAGLVAVFGAIKSRGLSNAVAAGLTAILLATLVLLVIVVQLFVGG